MEQGLSQSLISTIGSSLHYLDCLVRPQWKMISLDLLALDNPGEGTMGQGFLKVGLGEEKGRGCNQAVKWTFKIFLKRNLKSKKQKISKDILHKSKLWSNRCLRSMINYNIFNLVSSLLVPLNNYLQLDCQSLCKKTWGNFFLIWTFVQHLQVNLVRFKFSNMPWWSSVDHKEEKGCQSKAEEKASQEPWAGGKLG